MARKIEFEAWKKAAIEAWRAFVPAFIAVAGTQLAVGSEGQDVWVWLKSVLIAAALAGVRAVFKYVRDVYGQGDYTKLIYKLPF